ncbi:MAG: hypothetical protein RL444_1430 [Verrucomicrobiota bacterium]|jgi:hypothetical protein
MDWQVKPIARVCAASGKELHVGDLVTCVVFKPVGGNIERLDVLKEHSASFKPEGILLGRWSREVKERGEEDQAQRAQLLASREEFFLSLYEDAADPSGDKAVLKHILAMLLERKRIIKQVGAAAEGQVTYVHAASKQTYLVPVIDLQPAHILQVGASLDMLVG